MRVIGFATMALAMSSAPPVLILPGMGGSCLFYKKHQKVWPSMLPSDLRRVMEMERTVGPAPLGEPRGILNGDWVSRIVMGQSFYGPLMKRLGGENVLPMPYDFRLLMDPGYLEELYDEYEGFLMARKEPVMVFCHSLGGLLFHDFLMERPSVRRWVKRVIYINCPFGGSLMPIPLLMGRSSLRLLPRTMSFDRIGGLYWCLPWEESEREIVGHEGGAFKVRELEHLIRDPMIRDRYTAFLLPRKSRRLRSIEGVETHVMCSAMDHRTLDFFHSTDSEQHRWHNDGGDGVVPSSSLRIPERHWKREMEIFSGTDHTTILEDPRFLDRCAELAERQGSSR